MKSVICAAVTEFAESVREGTSGRVIIYEALGDGIGIFAEDRGLGFALDLAQPRVVAGLNSGVVAGGVHDVWLHENYRALIKAIGEEVAHPQVRLSGDGANVGGFRGIGIGRQVADFGKGGGDAGPNLSFLLVGALEQLLQEREALVGEEELLVGVRAVENEVEMAAIGEKRLLRVAPSFGIEVEAEDQVRLEDLVNPIGAGTNFGGAIKEALCEFLR